MDTKVCTKCEKERRLSDCYNDVCKYCKLVESRRLAIARRIELPRQQSEYRTVAIESNWKLTSEEYKNLAGCTLCLPRGWTRVQAMETRRKLIHEINVWAIGSFLRDVLTSEEPC